MSKLSAARRRALPARDFALPAEREYPINDHSHAAAALRDMTHESARKQQQIRAAIQARYPGLGERGK
jgi:hypothetical protein